MKYKFKQWMSTTEMVEVMKILKWSERKDGEMVIDKQTLDAHPELLTYFEPIGD